MSTNNYRLAASGCGGWIRRRDSLNPEIARFDRSGVRQKLGGDFPVEGSVRDPPDHSRAALGDLLDETVMRELSPGIEIQAATWRIVPILRQCRPELYTHTRPEPGA